MIPQSLRSSNESEEVKSDFTSYHSLHQCPDWWRNVVSHTANKKDVDLILQEFNVIMVDHITEPSGIDSLIFKSVTDFELFKLYWILRGEGAW
jgi:hypothetical protein